MSDRALQDELIRYLSDAGARAHPAENLPLAREEAAKAGRFAHFLARRYYRDRLVRSFRYTRPFQPQTGRLAEEIVDSPQFNSFLEQCVLGSLAAARRVGEMAVVHLDTAPHPGPWWRDLVEYEYAYFLQTATSEPASRTRRHTRCASAFSQTFSWFLPEVLERLRSGQPVGDDLHRECTLLFSRTHLGKIFVVELEKDAAAVFRSANGFRTPGQIATSAGVPVEVVIPLLEQFVEIGAVEAPA
ncbi:MAG: hypothetical protein ACRD2Y_15805 [Terriglobales bacterium]